MTTEKFTLEEFKAALPKQAEYKGVVYGEHCFYIPLGKAELVIRSSIHENGVAASAGDDSIRFVLMANGKVLGKSADTYTQRTPGWQGRLLPKIEYLISLRQQALDCSRCGSPLSINLVKKPGPNHDKICAWCPNGFDHKQWKVLSDKKPAQSLDNFTWPGQDKELVEVVRQSVLDMKPQETKPVEVIQPVPASSWSDAVAEEQPNKKVETPTAILGKIDLSQLNKYQREVVENAGKGVMVIDSCPGSGKTKTLETLVAYMIIEKGVSPSEIGCFTFSFKAASEMRRRIARSIWPDISDAELKFFGDPNAKYENPLDEAQYNEDWIKADPIRTFLVKWVCTIHALAFRLLKEWYGPAKKMNVINGNFKMMMQADQLIKDSLLEMKWKESPKSVKAYIGGAIRGLVPTYKAEEWFHRAIEGYGGPTYRARELAIIYDRYCNFMMKNGLIDFDMMQAEVVKLIRTNPQFVFKIQHLFKYILADEAQDTDGTQSEILFTMAGFYRNLAYIGDADQLLYAWRGAVPEIMTTRFDDFWKSVSRFQLPINYRSTQSIVKASSKFIVSNYDDDHKKYLKEYNYRQDAAVGKPLDAVYLDDFEELCRVCVEKVADSDNPGDWYILSRTRAECAAIHTALVSAGVPSINKSGGMLFGSEHIKKVIAYMRLSIDFNGSRDNLEVLGEVANVASRNFISSVTRKRHDDNCPYREKLFGDCNCQIIMKEGQDHSHTRYYGKESIQQAGGWDGIYRQTFETRWDRTSRQEVKTMKAKGASDLVSFVESCEKYSGSASDCARYVIDECVMPWLLVERGISDEDPAESSELEDFALIINMIQPGMTVEDFLVEIDKLSNRGKGMDEDKSVIVSTVHYAKGAERPKVIANLTRMPIVRPPQIEGQLVTSKPATLLEERCVSYVAITRAKDELYIVASKKWLGKDLPRSIFYDEILSASGLKIEEEN